MCSVRIEAVFRCGIPIPDRDYLDIARRLRAAGFDDEAERLEDALRNEITVLRLEITEREAILRALADCPDVVLAERRARILRDVAWSRQHGLA
jgi:hypothetical protein